MMSRGIYRNEMFAWLFLAMLFGAIDGGIAGVIAKNAFEDAVSLTTLNIVVAVLSSVGAIANLTSFIWASIGQGRPKVRLIVWLQWLAVLAVAQVAIAPRSSTGLTMLVIGVLVAGIAWSGIVTLRSTMWRANYALGDRARLTGNIATIQALVLATIGTGIGAMMEVDARLFPVIFVFAAIAGVIGIRFFSRVRIRGEKRLLVQERSASVGVRLVSPMRMVRLLRDDRPYRNFMGAMFVFGTGNVATTAPLIIMLRDDFAYGYLGGVLIMTVIPTLAMPLVIPIWARLLSKYHVVHFRAIHAWIFTTASLFMLGAALVDMPALLWIASIFRGAAFAGGAIAWNIGHLDFATESRTNEYMGVHVTLEGVRGLIGPIVGLGSYKLFETLAPGTGAWAFGVAFLLNAAGAVWFGRQSKALGSARRR